MDGGCWLLFNYKNSMIKYAAQQFIVQTLLQNTLHEMEWRSNILLWG
jgi:hypothetical protein